MSYDLTSSGSYLVLGVGKQQQLYHMERVGYKASYLVSVNTLFTLYYYADAGEYGPVLGLEARKS